MAQVTWPRVGRDALWIITGIVVVGAALYAYAGYKNAKSPASSAGPMIKPPTTWLDGLFVANPLTNFAAIWYGLGVAQGTVPPAGGGNSGGGGGW